MTQDNSISECLADLEELFDMFFQNGKYEDGISIANDICEIIESDLGITYQKYPYWLNKLAMSYYRIGDYDKAESLYEKALEILQKTVGENNTDYADILGNLAANHKISGDYDKAESLYEKALEVTSKVLGENHRDYAITLNNLAEMHCEIGDYDKAESLYEKALEILQKTVGENHRDYVITLSNIALLYKQVGDYDKAESLYEKALSTKRNILGENHRDYVITLSNLAAIKRIKGDYNSAESIYQQALDILHKTIIEENHLDYATIYDGQATVCFDLGDYDKAELLYERVLDIRHKILGENHPDYAFSLNNLAAVYSECTDYEKAIDLYQQALEILRKAWGPDNLHIAQIINNLALQYYQRREYAKAEPLYQRALDIWRKKVISENHPNYAQCVNNLAELYSNMGKYSKAEPLYKKSLEIRSKQIGVNNLEYTYYLSNLALLYIATGRLNEAMDTTKQTITIINDLMGHIFSITSERQRMAFIETIWWNMCLFLSLVVRYYSTDREAIYSASDLIILRKGIAARVSSNERKVFLSDRYPDMKSILEKLNSVSTKISNKALTGPTIEEDLETYNHQLTEWNITKDNLESKLARYIPEIELEQKINTLRINRQVVSNALPAGAAIVEFVHVIIFDSDPTLIRDTSKWKPHYLAFVLNQGDSGNIKMIDLGESDPIDKMIIAFNASISRRIMNVGNNNRRNLIKAHNLIDLSIKLTSSRNMVPILLKANESISTGSDGTDLRAAIFDPLKDALAHCSKIFFAPDGQLNNLPFELLPTTDNINKRLIDHYQISYITSARDTLYFGLTSNELPSDPMIFADPDFDLGSEQKSEYNTYVSKAVAFPPLRGTQEEGKQISSMLGVQPIFSKSVLKSNIKNCRSPFILHIATHGFFLPNEPIDMNRGNMNSSSIVKMVSWHKLQNPFLRSGLALAGANNFACTRTLPKEAEDGILTAEDVSRMDLTDTHLVVLSACETGLGDIVTGEGVFGLRRAFVLAGAQTLIMSLWKVPDEQTKELMVDFYKRLLTGKSRAEALREAQLAMKEKYPDPYYWGAFICQGNPGPLSNELLESMKGKKTN